MKFVPKELKETADISRGRNTWKSFLKNALGVVLAFVALYLVLGVLASLAASTVPDKWEAKLFSWKMEDEAQGGEELERSRALFKKLVESGTLRPLSYRLILLDIPQPNAFAMPGGLVGVTSGLLDEVTSETGMAMVLAHELGHHQGRHCLKRLGRTILFQVAIAVIFGESGGSGAQAALSIAESGYSRRQEKEADEFGLKLAHKTLGLSDGCLEFFEKIHAKYESDTARWSAFFASHPYTLDRIEYLRALQRQLSEVPADPEAD